MTVRELIKILETYDGDLHVLVQGYEGGYNDCLVRGPSMFGPNPEEAWYEGPYEDCAHDDSVHEAFRAIVLRRTGP